VDRFVVKLPNASSWEKKQLHLPVNVKYYLAKLMVLNINNINIKLAKVGISNFLK